LDLYFAKVTLYYIPHDKLHHYHLHLSDVKETKEFILGFNSSYVADGWLNAFEDHIMMANMKSTIAHS
jgi:hypothetical protein